MMVPSVTSARGPRALGWPFVSFARALFCGAPGRATPWARASSRHPPRPTHPQQYRSLGSIALSRRAAGTLCNFTTLLQRQGTHMQGARGTESMAKEGSERAPWSRAAAPAKWRAGAKARLIGECHRCPQPEPSPATPAAAAATFSAQRWARSDAHCSLCPCFQPVAAQGPCGQYRTQRQARATLRASCCHNPPPPHRTWNWMDCLPSPPQ